MQDGKHMVGFTKAALYQKGGKQIIAEPRTRH
jgi:hypothetical protein